MQLSIIIVNYNVSEEVDQCLDSILKVVKVESEIIVVDNNSSDRSIELVSEKYSNVKFYYLAENLGFAQANNFAAEKCSGDFILFLNPDTIVIEDFISPIISFISTNQKIGACGPMLLNSNNSFQGSTGISMGYIYETCEALMLIKYLRFFYFRRLKKKAKNKSPLTVSWLSAACLIISKELFKKVSGFNPDFFLNYEDIDLCERIRKSGYRNYYFPDLKCIHSEHASQKNNMDVFVFNRYKSRIIYAGYHYNSFKRIIINSIHILGLIFRLIFVKLIYSGSEQIKRADGYTRALKLYFG